MSSSDIGFDDWARDHGLTKKTITILKKEDIDQRELLSLMKEDEVENLNLTIGQKVLLKEVVRRLKLINIESVANSVSLNRESTCEQSIPSEMAAFCQDCKHRFRRISSETCSTIGLSQVSCDFDDVVSTVSYYDLPSDNTISNLQPTREVVQNGITGKSTTNESGTDIKKNCLTCLYSMPCKIKTLENRSNLNKEQTFYMLTEESDRQNILKKGNYNAEPVTLKRSQVYLNCNYYCKNIPALYDDKIAVSTELKSETEGYLLEDNFSLPPELVARTALEVLLKDFSRILQQSH